MITAYFKLSNEHLHNIYDHSHRPMLLESTKSVKVNFVVSKGVYDTVTNHVLTLLYG